MPLWNQDRVIGALHDDTPLRAGSFTADDLDLLTALGNFAAGLLISLVKGGQVQRLLAWLKSFDERDKVH